MIVTFFPVTLFPVTFSVTFFRDFFSCDFFSVHLLRMYKNKIPNEPSHEKIILVSVQVRHKPVRTVTEAGQKFEISDLFTIYEAKTKTLMSCTAPLFSPLQVCKL